MSIVVGPSNTFDSFDTTLSPKERLRTLAEKSAVAQDSELGVGYYESKSGQAELVFSDIESGVVVSIPTRATRAEVEKIVSSILPLEETKFMLMELAKAYDQKTPIMFEGGTAIGKTFAVNSFAKLIYGPKAVIPDFYCNGQTDVSELMGKYVPAGVKPEQQAIIKQYLNSDAGKALKAEIIAESGGQYEYKELYARAAVSIGIPIDEASFEFQLGVLPKAMTAGFDPNGDLEYTSDGPGVMMHIQEVGLASPSVINALLKIRGEQGRMAEEIQVWEDGGRRIKTGPGAFIVFSTNPVGKGFQERFEIDKALARSVVWVTLPDKLSDQSILKAASQIFSFDRIPPQKNTIVDLSKHSEITEILGGLMAKFHKIYGEMLEKGESGRRQKVPATIDSLWRVAELVQEVQVPKSNYEGIDLIKTLKKAVESIYINALQDKPYRFGGSADLRNATKETLGGKILGAFDEILTHTTTSLIDFREKRTTPKHALEVIEHELFTTQENDVKQKAVQEIKTNIGRKAAFQELVNQVAELKSLNVPGWERVLQTTLPKLSPEERVYILDYFGFDQIK